MRLFPLNLIKSNTYTRQTSTKCESLILCGCVPVCVLARAPVCVRARVCLCVGASVCVHACASVCARQVCVSVRVPVCARDWGVLRERTLVGGVLPSSAETEMRPLS